MKVLKTYPGKKAATLAIGNFICHFHFLKAIGKKLFGDENDIIRKSLRKHNVRVILRRTRKRLEAIIADTTDLVPEIVKGIEH